MGFPWKIGQASSPDASQKPRRKDKSVRLILMPRPQTDLVAMIRQAFDYKTIYGGRGLRGELYDLQAR